MLFLSLSSLIHVCETGNVTLKDSKLVLTNIITLAICRKKTQKPKDTNMRMPFYTDTEALSVVLFQFSA